MAEATEAVIDAQRLTRNFGAFVAVDHIDVHLAPGEVYGLLGANGAGKTTAIRMLCGTLAPSAGSIRVAGVDIVRQARRARARIGYVAQRFALYDDLKVIENLRLQAGLYGLSGARREARLAWAFEHLGLEAGRNTYARDLPLGYKRRLALAAALLHEPQVLFLDEPTSGVDPLARQQFWELIYALGESGVGILVTTHYMDEALFCDRLSLMHAGRIVAEGTPDALLRRPLATPILELASTAYTACMNVLQTWPEIREIVPHAGRLRMRLQPGFDTDALIVRLRTELQARRISVDRLDRAAPELEDVFVSILEQAGGT